MRTQWEKKKWREKLFISVFRSRIIYLLHRRGTGQYFVSRCVSSVYYRDGGQWINDEAISRHYIASGLTNRDAVISRDTCCLVINWSTCLNGGNILTSDFTIFPLLARLRAPYTALARCAEDGVRPGYYRIRFRRRLPSCAQPKTATRPSARRNSLSSNRSSYSEPPLSRYNVLLQPRWLLLLRTATSFARPLFCFFLSLSLHFLFEAICIFQREWLS